MRIEVDIEKLVRLSWHKLPLRFRCLAFILRSRKKIEAEVIRLMTEDQ